MALLGALTPRESDRLWWQMHRAVNHTADEIARLARCRASTRHELYGAGILEATVGVLADLEDVLETDLAGIPAGGFIDVTTLESPEV